MNNIKTRKTETRNFKGRKNFQQQGFKQRNSRKKISSIKDPNILVKKAILKDRQGCAQRGYRSGWHHNWPNSRWATTSARYNIPKARWYLMRCHDRPNGFCSTWWAYWFPMQNVWRYQLFIRHDYCYAHWSGGLMPERWTNCSELLTTPQRYCHAHQELRECHWETIENFRYEKNFTRLENNGKIRRSHRRWS